MSTMNRVLGNVVVLALLLLGFMVPGFGAEPNSEIETWDVLMPQIALAPDGNAWLAWVADAGEDWEILASRWNGQSWGPPALVFSNPERWDTSPSLTFDAEGTAWLAWASSTGSDDTLHLSHWTGHGWSNPASVPAGDAVSHRQPTLVATPGGGLWLAWVGFDGIDDEIYAAFWDGVAWSAPMRVGADDARPEDYDTQPRLAIGPGGDVWIAWIGHQALYDTEVYVSRWDGAHWSVQQQANADDSTPDVSPTLAVDAQGRVWLAWQGWADAPGGPQARIFAATGGADGQWTPEVHVSLPLTAGAYESQPSLALDAAGQPHLAWTVSGRTPGLGYTIVDGDGWLPPTWAVAGVRADEPRLLVAGVPQLYWLETQPPGSQPLHHRELSSVRSPLTQPPAPTSVDDMVVNRHLAFGDSITWGQFDDPPGTPVGPYPQRLEEKLDTRVVASEVVNAGQPGERTGGGLYRLKEEELPAHNPNFVEIMEGTNDVTHYVPYDEVAFNLLLMVGDSKNVDAKPLLATLIPRQDSFNDETFHQNTYIRDVAHQENVPLVDNWAAFYAYGQWQDLMLDALHPNSQGMQFLADTFYNVLLDSYGWLYEETESPTTWIDSLPAQSNCGQVPVSWTGTDNLSWVVDFDVQVQVNGGAWADWLVATTATSAVYDSASYGDSVGFRVRGRDVVGNQSDYSAAAYTTISDDDPPTGVGLTALPTAQIAPFAVRWAATDACSDSLLFDVQYRVGPAGTWTNWLVSTPSYSSTFDPATPAYGQRYDFRVRARDEAGNWSDWSSSVSTYLAQFALTGEVVNVRHEPVAAARVVVTEALAAPPLPGGYVAYVADPGDYDLRASHEAFGPLPARHVLSVTSDLAGLDFVLPPLDDVVADGGFETGSWGAWQPGGSLAPGLVAGAHTGDGAARLGGAGETSSLAQVLSVPGGLADATLSFLVRLDDGAGGSSTLQVELAGTTISQTVTVPSADWTHVWLPADAALNQAVTLTLTLSGTPAIRLDEVSLGSAASAGTFVHLPVVVRGQSP